VPVLVAGPGVALAKDVVRVAGGFTPRDFLRGTVNVDEPIDRECLEARWQSNER
jgi:hypothetical protein